MSGYSSVVKGLGRQLPGWQKKKSAYRYESESPEHPELLEEKAGPPRECNVAWGEFSSSTNPETQRREYQFIDITRASKT